MLPLPPAPFPDSAMQGSADLLTFAFDRSSRPDDLLPIYVDALNPSFSLNARQFRLLVRLLIAGLRAQNVRRGDCVLVNLGNSVRAKGGRGGVDLRSSTLVWLIVGSLLI